MSLALGRYNKLSTSFVDMCSIEDSPEYLFMEYFRFSFPNGELSFHKKSSGQVDIKCFILVTGVSSNFETVKAFVSIETCKHSWSERLKWGKTAKAKKLTF